MRGSMQTALSTGQEAHLEAEAIAADIAALVDVIAELSKDAVAYLHALDPTGAFSLSSAAPSKHAGAGPCLKGILDGLAAIEKTQQ